MARRFVLRLQIRRLDTVRYAALTSVLSATRIRTLSAESGLSTKHGASMNCRNSRGSSFVVAIGLTCFLALVLGPAARAQDPPIYKVDPSWPQPLPTTLLMQGILVRVTDKDDPVSVIKRPRDLNPDES